MRFLCIQWRYITQLSPLTTTDYYDYSKNDERLTVYQGTVIIYYYKLVICTQRKKCYKMLHGNKLTIFSIGSGLFETSTKGNAGREQEKRSAYKQVWLGFFVWFFFTISLSFVTERTTGILKGPTREIFVAWIFAQIRPMDRLLSN